MLMSCANVCRLSCKGDSGQLSPLKNEMKPYVDNQPWFAILHSHHSITQGRLLQWMRTACWVSHHTYPHTGLHRPQSNSLSCCSPALCVHLLKDGPSWLLNMTFDPREHVNHSCSCFPSGLAANRGMKTCQMTLSLRQLKLSRESNASCRGGICHVTVQKYWRLFVWHTDNVT